LLLQPLADLQEFLSLLAASLLVASLLVSLVDDFLVFFDLLLEVFDESLVVVVVESVELELVFESWAGAAVAPKSPVMAAATRRDFTECFIFNSFMRIDLRA
jgi:hypothetical protein